MGSIAVGSACGLIDNGAEAACRFDAARLEAGDRETSPAPLPTKSELDAMLQSTDENARKSARGVASPLESSDQKIEASFRATLVQPLLKASARYRVLLDRAATLVALASSRCSIARATSSTNATTARRRALTW